MNETSVLPVLTPEAAGKRGLISEIMLSRMHLYPIAAPVAVYLDRAGREIRCFDPRHVSENAPGEAGGAKKARRDAGTGNSHEAGQTDPDRPGQAEKAGDFGAGKNKGRRPFDTSLLPAPEKPGELPLLTGRRAERLKCYTAAALRQMYYEPEGEPVALLLRRGREERLPLYPKCECRRLPLPCARCGAPLRAHGKLCAECYHAEIEKKRAEGDRRRNAFYGYDPREVLFFDLEMTGVYEHDEVLSVSVADGTGETVFHTLVKPERKKRWNRTEKIHGITPADVAGAPGFSSLFPALRDLFIPARRLIAFGTNTDAMHLVKMFRNDRERREFHEKLLDCSAEFSHYVTEHELPLSHLSLSDAVAALGLTFAGQAHTSLADTLACRAVFLTLFPHYFEKETN